MPREKREYLRELVSQKARWTRALTAEEKKAGFLGWHERGYLPHCDYPGLTQFVTIRLADSMPASRRGEWEQMLLIESDRERRKQLEDYLDRGMGHCGFRDRRNAELATAALLHFQLERYELRAWCVMPNHIHLLANIWQTPMFKLVQGWKRYIAAKCGRRGVAERRTPIRRFWERDYWDTFMRDEKQEAAAIRYVENNPVKAGLCRSPDEWPHSSARFRDEYRRLRWAEGSTGVVTSGQTTNAAAAPNRSSALRPVR